MWCRWVWLSCALPLSHCSFIRLPVTRKENRESKSHDHWMYHKVQSPQVGDKRISPHMHIPNAVRSYMSFVVVWCFCVLFVSVCLMYVLVSILTALRREDIGFIQANSFCLPAPLVWLILPLILCLTPQTHSYQRGARRRKGSKGREKGKSFRGGHHKKLQKKERKIHQRGKNASQGFLFVTACVICTILSLETGSSSIMRQAKKNYKPTLILYSFNFSSKSAGGGLVQKHFNKEDTISAALKQVWVDSCGQCSDCRAVHCCTWQKLGNPWNVQQ